MKRYIILSVLSLFVVISVSAQDDDMYFTPKKSSKASGTTQQRSAVAEGSYGAGSYDADDDVAYYSGSLRDVDEYNRRDRSGQSYSQQDGAPAYRQDSILVSVEDYENSMKMKRFDGYNNIALIVNDPWYYDPWYYDPFYWGGRWCWPWRYSCYDPWYHGPSWYGYWGYHGWGFGIGWHHPVYTKPIITHRPSTGRPGIGRPNGGGYGYRRTPASASAGRRATNMIGNMSNRSTTTTRRTTTTNTTSRSTAPSTRSSMGSSSMGSGSRGTFGGGSRGGASRSGGGARMSRR